MEGEHPKPPDSAFKRSGGKGYEDPPLTPDVGDESAGYLCQEHVTTSGEIFGLFVFGPAPLQMCTFFTYLTSNTFITPILLLIASLTEKCITNKNE